VEVATQNKSIVTHLMIGDDLRSYANYGRFNGLDATINFEMPHIYLDSRMAGGRKVNAIFDPSQIIQLEGDFGRYFNVFVPQKYEAVALSILSPDVMETLRRYASSYDVEVYADHVRVISSRQVLNSPERQAELIEITDKLMAEIEHRAVSWSEQNSFESIDQDLRVYPLKGIRVGTRYIASTALWLGAFWLLCTSPFLILTGYSIYIGSYRQAIWIGLLNAASMAGLIRYTKYSLDSGRFWSRKG
jgi:hypothetical protein